MGQRQHLPRPHEAVPVRLRADPRVERPRPAAGGAGAARADQAQQILPHQAPADVRGGGVGARQEQDLPHVRGRVPGPAGGSAREDDVRGEADAGVPAHHGLHRGRALHHRRGAAGGQGRQEAGPAQEVTHNQCQGSESQACYVSGLSF